MNCEICFNQYDHSIHKPYSLSCPHTVCISCISNLNSNKCPTCKTEIKSKNPNIALLNFIPESEFDKLKASSQKIINEISEINNTVQTKSETKLNEYLHRINLIRNEIKKEASELIEQVKASEEELLREASEIVDYLKKNLALSQEESDALTRLARKKHSIEINSISAEGLVELIKIANVLKKRIKKLENQVNDFKENIEFTPYKLAVSSLKDRLIGEINTNQKVIFL
jgi:hypothetical protein